MAYPPLPLLASMYAQHCYNICEQCLQITALTIGIFSFPALRDRIILIQISIYERNHLPEHQQDKNSILAPLTPKITNLHKNIRVMGAEKQAASLCNGPENQAVSLFNNLKNRWSVSVTSLRNRQSVSRTLTSSSLALLQRLDCLFLKPISLLIFSTSYSNIFI